MSVEDESCLGPNHQLVSLRVSVARIAQALGVDNELHVTGEGFSGLTNKAQAQAKGWNDLAARCTEAAATRRSD
jgi:hypothetical protein